MRFVNLTPHSLTVWEDTNTASGGRPVTLYSHGVARVGTDRITCGRLSGFEITQQTFTEVQGLPHPVEGVMYIVSAVVLAALAGTRPDVVAPDTGPTAIRENGQIVAVKGFVR